MDESSPDIVAKYQKLATEYSKIRAQVPVLKKAVSEEQAKSNELKETLKSKDQSIRKLEQEVECLNFRNLQLTKRVSVLQTELETVEDKIKKNKHKPASNSVPSSSSSSFSEDHSILNTELQSRIEENERLHQQVYSSELEHKKVVFELLSKVDTLESELQKQHSSLSETIKKHETTIDKLSQDRAKMEVTLKRYEKELKDVNLKEGMCKDELFWIKDDLGKRLEETNKILKEKIVFNDTRLPVCNSLNVPVLLHKKESQLTSLLLEFKGFISELVRRLSDLHTYMEQKIRGLEPNTDIAGPISKFVVYLHENSQYLKLVETSFSDFVTRIQSDSAAWLETACLRNISSALSKYVRYLEKLLPYLLLCIQAEDRLKGTTPRLKEIYKKLDIISGNLTLGFNKLDRHVLLLVEAGSMNSDVTYYASRSIILKIITTSLDNLLSLFEESRKIFGAKVSIDHQLPTATETSKNTDDCILSSIVSVITIMKKINISLNTNNDLLSCEIPYRPRAILSQGKFVIHPCVSTFKDRGLKYMNLLKEDEAPSIPYEEALNNSRTLRSYADSRESLAQQLEACKSKLAKLEMDREHWMLECQLLKTKQSRNIQSPIKENGDSSPDDDQTFQFFVKSSVNHLITQIQFADSKTLAFQAECEFLHQKLKLAETKQVELEKEMNNTKAARDHLKEEQQTLMKNYEDQLSMMSEHLANMNEKLTAQKDEIDALKQLGNTKASKKNKGR